MTKKFILNVLLNLGIVFLVLSGFAGYNSGQPLYLGLSIALLVVLIYLKVVLLKQVNRDVKKQAQQSSAGNKKGKNKSQKNKK